MSDYTDDILLVKQLMQIKDTLMEITEVLTDFRDELDDTSKIDSLLEKLVTLEKNSLSFRDNSPALLERMADVLEALQKRSPEIKVDIPPFPKLESPVINYTPPPVRIPESPPAEIKVIQDSAKKWKFSIKRDIRGLIENITAKRID